MGLTLGKVFSLLLAIFEIVAIIPSFSIGDEPPFLLPKDRDSIFRQKASSHTGYFHFAKDGSYQQIAREHLFTAEMDRGSWKQNATGEIELQSSIRLKELKKGPMRIEVRDIEKLEALLPLEKDIEEFLATDKSDSWPREKIESAWKCTYTTSLFKSTTTVKSVAVAKGVEKITRNELIELLDAWRAYLKDDERNHFHLLPVKYDRFVLLASEDYPFMANAKTPEEVKKTAILFRTDAAPELPPELVFVLVDSESVLQEMKTKQPFIFFPQFTRGGEEVLRYK
jgi:hypothetical protein